MPQGSQAAHLRHHLLAELWAPCRRVCELIEQICDLSERICLIAGQHRDDQELADRCAAGEERCRRSRDRVPPGCSCQPSR